MSIDVAWVASQFPGLAPLSLMAAGGQKWVFRADHARYGACVLKLFKPGAADRVDRELEAVIRLQLPNVPRIYESGTIPSPIGPLAWLSEQYIEGTPLAEILAVRPLSQAETFSLAGGLLAIAVAAEDARVVHRDIKPANIVIGPEGAPWLLDFGIARLLDMESKTNTDAQYGPHSPGYGAPEQFRNRKAEVDCRSDLFAIGVVIYESVTGSNPFLDDARDRLEILKRVESMQLPALDLAWDPGHEFSDFVATLTQKRPYRRPRNCREAFDWLDALILRGRGAQ